MRPLHLGSVLVVVSGAALAACSTPSTPPPAADPVAVDATADVPPDEAAIFVLRTETKLRELWTRAARAEWAKATNITAETVKAAADAQAEVMAFETEAIKAAAHLELSGLSQSDRRKVELLKLTSTLPAPDDDAKRQELAQIAATLEGMYGTGKYCPPKTPDRCLDLGELSDIIAKERDPKVLEEMWTGWRQAAIPMRPLYQRMVELANEGAHELGFADVGVLWRSRYDMAPEAFAKEMDRLWDDVRPLYEALHCHVRARLHDKYGAAVVPPEGPLPAHLLGNMWAQDWSNLYPMLEPYPKEPSIDVSEALVRAKYDERKMVKQGEAFFTSLGLDPLPETFWERSMFEKPKDREVVCHASAWDVTMDDDLRIKMCIKINHEDFVTIHHELGHNYYFHNYYNLPVLFQSGAHDGFHEAIGDAIALSITPQYLVQIGLLERASETPEAVINKQLQVALAKVAFLPFGKMVDQWRWDVFSGEITPDGYNQGWWALRHRVQGIAPPIPRTETDFDPGAKFHIPGNTPYARYFLAHILQFQFHRALCRAAGHEGPLHQCSVYGSKTAGERLKAMLALGSSRPWPEALELLTGTREMDAGALIEYFQPLMSYLEAQNAGRQCGWT